MTYSKTRATKDNTAQYSPTTEPSETTLGELNITPSSQFDNPEETPVVPSAAKDRFASPEYVNPNARLPRIQALRGGVIRSV